MSAIILAKTIRTNRLLLDVKDELAPYVRRLYKYGIFTVTEISEIADISEYKVRQAITGLPEYSARSGIKPSHLDHLVRMVGAPEFAKLHVRSLIVDGATVAALARVTGLPETSIRRWSTKERTND